MAERDSVSIESHEDNSAQNFAGANADYPLSYGRSMKKQLIILLLLLAGCCVTSAQTTNAIASSNTPALLTAEQASSLALRLAYDKVYAKNNPREKPFIRDVQAHFMAGHWVWTNSAFSGYAVILATVNLAADGSTNSVDVKYTHQYTP